MSAWSCTIELIENRLMNPLADPVGLGAFGLGFSMLNVIKLQIKFVGTLIWSPAKLSPSVC